MTVLGTTQTLDTETATLSGTITSNQIQEGIPSGSDAMSSSWSSWRRVFLATARREAPEALHSYLAHKAPAQLAATQAFFKRKMVPRLWPMADSMRTTAR